MEGAIGPYRVERLLGRGGMGAVYLATDERLGRRVALKRLLPERRHDEARRRFAREARAIARLSHPAIVQLYDVLETDEGDVLVMEFVEGETLAARILRGPLPVAAALEVAAQVAEGLAAAHAAGVIHRDLKSENVRLTPRGQAKILDFGLALWADDGSGARLTGEGLALGTCRAMSPEQARGRAVDPRSDLFALGVLVHEMVTGVSPFAAPTAAETLMRVCTLEPPDLEENAPPVGPAAAAVTRRLLSKDPAGRPASAAEVAAAYRSSARPPNGTPASADAVATAATAASPLLAGPEAGESGVRPRPWKPATALAAVLLLLPALRPAGLPEGPATPVPASIAVPRVTVEAGRLSLLGGDLGLRSSLMASLAGLDGVSVLAPEEVDPVQGPPRLIAKATAADEIVTGRLACGAGQCLVTLARVRPDASLAWTRSFAADPTQPLLLREAVRAHVQEAFADRPPRRSAPPLQVTPDVYADFVELRHRFEGAAAGDALETYIARLQDLQRRAPRFVELLVAEADAWHRRFLEERDPAQIDRALAALDHAALLDADDARVLASRALVNVTGQRLAAAAAAVERLRRMAPGDPAVLLLRARLAEKRGDAAAARADLEEAARRQPSWRNLFRLAALESRHGLPARARAHLAEVLEVFPENLPAQSLLAELELLGGDAARAVALYTRLADRQPGITELSNLGLAHLLLRHFAEAEAVFRRAHALAPHNAFVALNLADAVELGRGRDAAQEHYRRAVDLSRADAAQQEGAPEWQLASVRAQALAHLGRKREAVGEVQRVLQLAGDRPQAHFEVSLVYAIVGEETSAAVSASRALEGGVERRWFDLPAFDGLRSTPAFAAAVSPPRVAASP